MNDINRIKNALFFLIRQGLWGNKEDAEKYFPLSPEEWQALYIHSRRQYRASFTMACCFCPNLCVRPTRSFCDGQWMSTSGSVSTGSTFKCFAR